MPIPQEIDVSGASTVSQGWFQTWYYGPVMILESTSRTSCPIEETVKKRLGNSLACNSVLHSLVRDMWETYQSQAHTGI